MRFWRFLQYEKSYLLFYAYSLLLGGIVFLTAPQTSNQWATAGYVALLISISYVFFLFVRYRQQVHAVRQTLADDAQVLSLEAEALQTQLEEMKKGHIRELNEIRAQRQAHDDFIVSWFHEIKTPIAVLRLLPHTDIDAGTLQEEVARIEHFVDQALYYAKLDSFNQDVDIKRVDLELLMKKVIKAHARTFISKKIRMDLQVTAMQVQSDVKWLQFICHQLISNSLKYTESGSAVKICTRATEQERQLVIRDDGIGINPQDLPRIFQRGFVGENGRAGANSTGMGLYLAQELSNKLGHYITCTSEVGMYTELVIHFPQDVDRHLQIKQAHETS